MLTIIFISFLAICISLLLLYILSQLAYKINNVEINYRGHKIPVGTGLLIPILFLCFYPLVKHIGQFNEWIIYCYLTVILGIVGFIDDRFGNKQIKGIKGHLSYLMKSKKMSTGFAKLVLITMVGFSVSTVLYEQLLTIIVCTITFAIWTNIVNLLDVRPGRAIKGFWLVTTITFSMHFFEIAYLEWGLVILSIPLFIVDINEWGMLGDSGSNILGGLIGFWIIAFSSNVELYIYLLIGSALTIYAEKKSFSKWIEKYPIIRRIDHWGRRVTD